MSDERRTGDHSEVEPTFSCSVVVGVRTNEHDPGACLQALEPQVGPDTEVIVVDDDAGEVYPAWIRHYSRPDGLVPELWALGLSEARGEVVALISGALVPDSGWLTSAATALNPGESAVGGAIEPGPGFGVVDWAVYFCRYSPFMLPFPGRVVADVPGDNAVYRLGVLNHYHHLWEQGFWEPFVHRAMVADGHRLVLRPDRVVRQASGIRARSMARQRFLHGRANGQRRSAGVPPKAVLTASLTTPLVPLLMTLRAARQVRTRRRHQARFVAALPLVLWFYSWWAAGELVGRLQAAGLRRACG